MYGEVVNLIEAIVFDIKQRNLGLLIYNNILRLDPFDSHKFGKTIIWKFHRLRGFVTREVNRVKTVYRVDNIEWWLYPKTHDFGFRITLNDKCWTNFVSRRHNKFSTVEMLEVMQRNMKEKPKKGFLRRLFKR